jgi:HlyD family secretion protein
MRKWLPHALVVVAVGAIALRYTVFRPDPVPVRVAAVEVARVESTITNSKAGTVKARRRAQISAEVGGRVVGLTHAEGDHVEEGEPLVLLDDATPRAQLRLAQQGLRVAQAAASEACISRDRARRELERKRSLVDRAQAQIAASEAERAKFVIRAPFGGVIAEQDVERGEWITPSPPLLTAPPVVDVIDPSSLYVSAPMDEVDSAKIRVGQSVKVTVDSHPGETFPARVARVAPYVLDVEAQNRTVEIEVEFEDPRVAATLLPGTSADVEVVLEVREDVLRVPTSALLEGQKVLVPSDGTLEERAIEIGLKNWDYAEVRSGLEAGQLVVTSLDRAEVAEGARIEIEDTTAQP